MSFKSVQFHIESNDYFGTLATILSLLDQSNNFNKDTKKVIGSVVNDLLFLQNNCIIVKKYDKNSSGDF